MKKVIVSLLVIILVAAVGVGGWYLWDSLQKEKNKTGELESKTEQLENKLSELEYKKDINQESYTNNTSINKEIKSFNEEDLMFNGVGLNDTLANALATYGENCDKSLQKEDASGENEITYTYKDGLIVKGLCSDEETDEGRIREIKLSQNLKTKRNIGVGSTVSDIKKSYKAESILNEDNDMIVVGFPGDTDEYSSKGRIYFSLQLGKVTEISMINSYAE